MKPADKYLHIIDTYMTRVARVISEEFPDLRNFEVGMNPVTKGIYKGSTFIGAIRYPKGMETTDKWDIQMKICDVLERLGMPTLKSSSVYSLTVKSNLHIGEFEDDEDFELWRRLQ